MSLQNFFDACGDSVELNAESLTVEWSRSGVGFGSVTFYKRDGKLYCDNECMSREFVRKVMTDLVDSAEFIDER